MDLHWFWSLLIALLIKSIVTGYVHISFESWLRSIDLDRGSDSLGSIRSSPFDSRPGYEPVITSNVGQKGMVHRDAGALGARCGWADCSCAWPCWEHNAMESASRMEGHGLPGTIRIGVWVLRMWWRGHVLSANLGQREGSVWWCGCKHPKVSLFVWAQAGPAQLLMAIYMSLFSFLFMSAAAYTVLI